eukprot:11178427-Alexandrium_andersonii.AAC.1
MQRVLSHWQCWGHGYFHSHFLLKQQQQGASFARWRAAAPGPARRVMEGVLRRPRAVAPLP